MLHRILLSGIVLTLAACADSPTEPGERIDPNAVVRTYEADVQGCVSDGFCVLPPISGGGCDPWMELDWCEGGGGSCMYSNPITGDPEFMSTMSCPIGGGGGGSGGGGGGSGGGTAPPPSSDPEKQYFDDLGWDCPGCGERAPTPEEKAIMQGLLSQIQCTDGRNMLSAMLGDGTLMVFTAVNQYYGAWDSNTQRIYISRPKHWPGGVVNGPELIDSMVHEMVHKLLGHVNGPQVHDQAWHNKMAACGFPQS